MPDVGTIIRARRDALGLDAQGLADLVGTTATQISRWENSRQEPTSSSLKALTRALGLSADELLGLVPIGLDLSGRWFAAWDTTRAGVPVVDRHTLTGELRGVDFTFAATGDYLWNGSLRFTDGSLMGTYLSTEADKVFRGSLYFILSEDASAAIGRWSGRWADGILGSGWGALARDEGRAGKLLEIVISHGGPLTEWPREDGQQWTPTTRSAPPTVMHLPHGGLKAAV